MNMNKLKPNNTAPRKIIILAEKKKDQATLFKRAKISHGYINQHQKQAFR